MQRTSENYVGTFYTESAADMLELERIRKAIKVVNRELRHFKYGSQEKKSGFGNEYYHNEKFLRDAENRILQRIPGMPQAEQCIGRTSTSGMSKFIA